MGVHQYDIYREVHDPTSKKRLYIVRLLLEAGADPMAVDHGGFTALHYACCDGLLSLVYILLSRSEPSATATSANAVTRQEHLTPLHILLYYKYFESNEGFLRYDTIIPRGAKEAIAKRLIDAGADVRARDRYGRMPIWYARRPHNPPEVFDLLIRNGGDDGEGGRHTDEDGQLRVRLQYMC